MQPRALGCKAKTGRFARHWHRTGRASPPEHHHRPHAGAVPNVPPPTGWNRSQFRFGSASEVSTFEGQVCITPMNGHRQFDWVASRNIGRRLGRAVDIPGVHPSERDASRLLRWRQRSSLTHAATPTASCFIDRARVCAGPNAFPSVTDRTLARRVGLEPSSRRSSQTWWVRRGRRRA